jgi:hypothetical protein
MKAVMLVLAAALTPWIGLAQGQFEFGHDRLRRQWGRVQTLDN